MTSKPSIVASRPRSGIDLGDDHLGPHTFRPHGYALAAPPVSPNHEHQPAISLFVALMMPSMVD